MVADIQHSDIVQILLLGKTNNPDVPSLQISINWKQITIKEPELPEPFMKSDTLPLPCDDRVITVIVAKAVNMAADEEKALFVERYDHLKQSFLWVKSR